MCELGARAAEIAGYISPFNAVLAHSNRWNDLPRKSRRARALRLIHCSTGWLRMCVWERGERASQDKSEMYAEGEGRERERNRGTGWLGGGGRSGQNLLKDFLMSYTLSLTFWYIHSTRVQHNLILSHFRLCIWLLTSITAENCLCCWLQHIVNFWSVHQQTWVKGTKKQKKNF